MLTSSGESAFLHHSGQSSVDPAGRLRRQVASDPELAYESALLRRGLRSWLRVKQKCRKRRSPFSIPPVRKHLGIEKRQERFAFSSNAHGSTAAVIAAVAQRDYMTRSPDG